MSYVFIEEQSDDRCNDHRTPLAQVVSKARYAVQIATKEATAGAAEDGGEVITPVHTGSYAQSRDTADGSVEYITIPN